MQMRNQQLSKQEIEFSNLVGSGMSRIESCKAVYSTGKMTDAQISGLASKIALRPRVKEYISSRIAESMSRFDVSIDKIVQELAAMGFANAQDIYDDNGKIIPVHKLPVNVAKAVIEVTERTVGDMTEVKYKLADKKANLELLGRHLQMFVDKLEIKTINDAYNDIIHQQQSSAKHAIRH